MAEILQNRPFWFRSSAFPATLSELQQLEQENYNKQLAILNAGSQIKPIGLRKGESRDNQDSDDGAPTRILATALASTPNGNGVRAAPERGVPVTPAFATPTIGTTNNVGIGRAQLRLNGPATRLVLEDEEEDDDEDEEEEDDDDAQRADRNDERLDNDIVLF